MSIDRSPFILAIDIGTSSVRTALFDRQAERVRGTLTQEKHQVTHSTDGAAELDSAVIERGLLRCLESTLSRVGKRPVTAVGVSSFWHSLLGTDARGKALTPIYTWADSRCREDAVRLRTEMREEEYHARTGCMLRASFWPAKLRWLARTQKRLAGRVARWQSPADWVRGCFCEKGAETSAYGMATGTGLFNPVTLDWDDALLDGCGVRREQLPVLDESSTELKPEYARRFPALARARWWAAIGDGAASNLGSGATRPGRAAINIGTSAAFRVMKEGRDAGSPLGLFCYRVDARRYVIGGAVSNAGNLRAWCRRELRLRGSETALDRALAQRPGPLRDLVTLPFWSAERAPTWCEELGGVLHGLSQNTTALDLLQATTEAVFHRLALIADRSTPKATRAGAPPLQIIVSGGILKSGGLLQRLADVLGRPIHASQEPEASLRGAAVYALEKMGIDVEAQTDIRKLIGPSIQPRRRFATLFAHERERQRKLEALMASAAALD